MADTNALKDPVLDERSSANINDLPKQLPAPCETSFPLADAFVNFFMTNAFFAEIGRHLVKIPTRDIPTAGVMFLHEFDEIRLYWNPDFFENLSVAEVQGVIQHELYHITFEHLLQSRVPEHINNIAQDLAINSIIHGCADERIALPACALIPGVSNTHETTSRTSPMATLIAKLKPGASSHQYFQSLIESDCIKHIDTIMTLDTHMKLPKEHEDYLKSKLNMILQNAANAADVSSHWGSIPERVQKAIRQHLSNVVDWRKVLDHFIGSSLRGRKRTSSKRLNKRYPYVHPGSSVSRRGKLLLAIDESGSVDSVMLEQFFSALRSLSREVDIDILAFDCTADVDDVFTWKKNTVPELKRTRTGGTNFSAPTRIVNDPFQRGRWDALLIMTDGLASAPESCMIPRAWVLTDDHKLLFTTTETIIRLSKNQLELKNM